MAENNEMSNTEKLERLSSLINSSGGEVAEEDFKEILNTLPVELVSFGRDLKGIFSKLKQKKNPQGVSKKRPFVKSGCGKYYCYILQILLLHFANTGKIPSPSTTTSKCVSTCDEYAQIVLLYFKLDFVFFCPR